MGEVEEVRKLASRAHAKMVAAGGQDWSEEEFHEWMDTLPKDEAIAVMAELIEMQGEADATVDAKTVDDKMGAFGSLFYCKPINA